MRQLKNIKIGIWIYFIILIIEGGLRRWVFPSLSNPILIIRDLLGIYLLIYSYRNNYFPDNRLVPAFLGIGIMCIFTALFFGHGNLFVALFGARIMIVQIPILFLIGHVFTQKDVIALGKVVLWLAIPMAILITIQFYSPQSAWVNRGVGDNIEGAGFSGANGYLRPPGTFSFTSGNVSFFSLVGCYVMYFWLQPKFISKSLLIASSFALLIAIPTSISRSLFFQFTITLFFFIWANSSRPGFLKNISKMAIGFAIVIIITLNFKGLEDPINAFTVRFTTANESEGGLKGVLIDRFLNGLITAFSILDDHEIIIGKGIGMGTNVGSQLLSGERKFLIAEGEWGRIIGEIGMVFGLTFIFIRIYMSFNYLFLSLKYLRNEKPLPWMLISTGFIILLQQQLSQPTNLGFYVLTGGLILASFKEEEKEEQ